MWLRRILRPARVQPYQVPDRRTARQRRFRLSNRAIRQLERLQLTASRDLRGLRSGQRASRRTQSSADFVQHRIYVPGDDVRYVDWKASARQEHIFVKQGELPKDAAVHLLLDCSASMAWGEPPKRLGQIALAAAIGYMALAGGDRLWIYPFGSTKNISLGPISGKSRIPDLLNYLRSLNYGSVADIRDALTSFKSQRPEGGLTFILSDLLAINDLEPFLSRFPPPAWDMVVLHLLHSREVQPSALGDVRMVDSETAAIGDYDVDARALEEYANRLAAWLDAVTLQCVQSKSFYALVEADASLEEELIPQLLSLGLVQTA